MRTIKVKDYSEIPKDFTGIAEYPDGSKEWYLNGKLHRDNDQPAIENANGSKEWRLNGELHRENDLPAIEFSNRTKQWYLNGRLHRENGPACEYSNGTRKWYYCDKQYKSFEEVQKVHQERIMNPNILINIF